MLEFDLPECLSITRYDSISGEELSPYRRLSAGCIKTYVGGYKPYQVIVHQNIPVRSIGIEITPAYYEDYLKKQYIPKAVESGFLQRPCLRRVMQAEEGEGISFSVQFHVKNVDTLNFWLQNEGNNLHRALVARFGHKIAGFSTLLEEIDWEK